MAANEESDPSAILNGFWVTLFLCSKNRRSRQQTETGKAKAAKAGEFHPFPPAQGLKPRFAVGYGGNREGVGNRPLRRGRPKRFFEVGFVFIGIIIYGCNFRFATVFFFICRVVLVLKCLWGQCGRRRSPHRPPMRLRRHGSAPPFCPRVWPSTS